MVNADKPKAATEAKAGDKKAAEVPTREATVIESERRPRQARCES
jgi:hypothetical protein